MPDPATIGAMIDYRPSATILALHNSNAFIKAVAGPPGGGKSVGAFMDGLLRAMRQPADREGVRRFRLACARATYPKLKTTTLKTVQDWMPREFGDVKLTAPMEGLYAFPLPDGTRVRFEVLFIALEDEQDIEDMKSLEVSMFWLHEATELSEAILRIAVQRVGRYPSMKNGVICAEPGVVLDFNLPDQAHWLYKRFVEGEPLPVIELLDGRTFTPTLQLLLQPAAVICENEESVEVDGAPPRFRLNPDAENLANLLPDYYANQLATLRWPEIRSFLLMRWTPTALGKLVHPEFSAQAHVGKLRTTPVTGEETLIGIDTSGLHPGAVFGQPQAGQLVVMDEGYAPDMAFEQFIQEVLLTIIAKRYHGTPLLAVCDPSNPRDSRTGFTPVQLLQRYQIRAIPAATNRFALRKAAVARLLNRRHGCVIDPACTMLIDGLGRSYVHRKLRATTTTGLDYANEPVKGTTSHVVEAFQYLAVHIAHLGPEEEVVDRSRVQVAKRRVV